MEWWQQPGVQNAATFGVVLVVLLALSRLALGMVSRLVADTAARYRLRKLVGFAAFVAAGLIALSMFSDRLGSMTVALGVAGAGIAFALQEVIASFAGWIAILAGGFYRTGDRVELGGTVGDVIDIGMLRTTLMETGSWVKGDLYNGRIVLVANSFVFKAPVFNYSSQFPFLWDEIVVPVRYGADRDWVRATLERVAAEEVGAFAQGAKAGWKDLARTFMIEEATVDPMITLVATDNWLEYTVRYVVDYKRRRTNRDRLFEHILDAFEAAPDKVKMASQTIELVHPDAE